MTGQRVEETGRGEARAVGRPGSSAGGNHQALSIRPWNEGISGIAYGGDYNPEQWPEQVWADDMRLMNKAGVSLVTLGIFSWAVVEPEPDAFDFSTFDAVVENLSQAGVRISLATMTASPPPWLARLHPGSLPMRADGTRLWPGSRQHYCPSSPGYRERAGLLVQHLADRYGDHPALAMWHIGNESGGSNGRCYCDASAEHFRRWLAERYGDLDGVNDAWSTTFWSQRYASFDEINPPRSSPTFPNPAQEIDYTAFSSNAHLECYELEKQIVNRASPQVPVTTNFIPMSRDIDPFEWGKHEDVASYDSYPDPHEDHPEIRAGFGYDTMRSLRDGQSWMLMEQAPSAVNWRDSNGPKPPGVMRLWSWQAVAQGADAVLFFQWRQSRGGSEKFHSAMVPHAGEDSRIYREVAELGAELGNAAELVGGRTESSVALVMDWRNWWALQRRSLPARLDAIETALAHYGPLFDASISVDVVPPDRDLSGYQLVMVPNLYLVSEQNAERITEYVRRGGHLLMSFFSGIVDECDRVHLGGYPAPFREMLGLHVEEFWPLPADSTIEVEIDGEQSQATIWSEAIRLEGAEQIGSFRHPDLNGSPAVTRNTFGAGTAWYLGTRPDPEQLRRLIDRVAVDAGVTPVIPGLPAGVQARIRESSTGRFLLLLNHSGTAVDVRLESPAVDLLAGVDDQIESVALPARGVAVLALQ